MNCQTFSALASDLARDQIMDAASRAQALAHAGVCPSCAVWLNAQQQLSSDLGQLALATKDQAASAAVWESLSAAFDARAVTPITANRRRRIYAAGAIAATLILALAVIQLVIRHQPANVEGLIAATFTLAQPAQVTSVDQVETIGEGGLRNATTTRRRHLRRQTLTPQLNQPKEIVTDFISLTYGAPEVGSDAQLVRVELPRSAMANFGLPVNMDRVDQRVKADVLLGADGLARAIRFVQ
jgi:hypothetical protein